VADENDIPTFESTSAIEEKAPVFEQTEPMFDQTSAIEEPKVETSKFTALKDYLQSFFTEEKKDGESTPPKEKEPVIEGATSAPVHVQAKAPKEAKSVLEALEAGFDISVTGLFRDKPDMVLPENAGMFYRIASQVGTLAGDVPAMVAGGVGGGAAGAAMTANPLGAVIGAGGGSFALPEAVRKYMMETYEKGEVQSFSDFWERSSAAAIEGLKGFAIGGVTAGAGAAVGKVIGPAVAPAFKTSAQLTTEVATMTTVGAALEGKAPEPMEFIDAAVLVGGLRATTAVASKIRNVYAKKGVTPVELAEKVDADPHIKQDLVSSNIEMPTNAELGIKIEKKVPENISTTKPLKEPNPDLSPEVNNVLQKVGEKSPAKKDGLSIDKTYTALVDKLDPINEAVKFLSKESGTTTLAENNPYVLARTSVDAKAKAKHFFEKGTIEFNGKNINGESFKSTLESVENPQVLEAYMISKRVLEKSKAGLETGFDVENARKVVEQNKAKYDEASKKVTEFSNRVLQYATDAGVLSKEQQARFLEGNKDYVPFKRLIEADDGSVGNQGRASNLKKFKGSEADIQSPILSIVENTVELIKMAEVNRPKAALIELANKTPGQELIKPVTEGGGLQLLKGLKDNQFSVFEDGKRKIYETTPELAEAVNRLGGDTTSTNLLFKIMNGITTVKKMGITLTPDFILRNMIRDTLTAQAFSKSKGISPIEIFGAMGDLVKKNDTYYEWLKSGGANGAFLEMGDKYVKNDIYKLQRETNFMNSVRNLVDNAVGAFRLTAELSEQSLRVAEFKKVRQMGGSLDAAGYASREITIDFQRVGAKISALNSITAFMNVSIQGLDRTARAFQENPTGMATKAAAYITAPSLLLWWANKDDERYKEIPRWEKDLFWIIPTDDWKDAAYGEANGLPKYMVREENGKIQVNKGTIYRIPKPQELGLLFGSMPERLMEKFFTDNPNSLKDFDESLINLITPSFVPDAIAPAVEQYFNKSFFTGRAIVPHYLKDILPEYQFVEYTSETAKTLGKMVATMDRQSQMASPMVIQNYIRSWGGSIGQYAVQVADAALEKAGVVPDKVKPEATLADIPFVKSFVVRFPNLNANSIQDFYDKYDESNKIIKTIKYLAKDGNEEGLQKEINLRENQENLLQLEGTKEALSNQQKFIRSVYKNPNMSPDEKRQMIDGAYLTMIETAKAGNTVAREFKKSLDSKNEEAQ